MHNFYYSIYKAYNMSKKYLTNELKEINKIFLDFDAKSWYDEFLRLILCMFW